MEVSNELLIELLEDKVRLSILRDVVRAKKADDDNYMTLKDIEILLGEGRDARDEN